MPVFLCRYSHTMRHLILFLFFLVSISCISAQNCLGIKNLDALNVAKQVDLDQIAFVSFSKNKIIAKPLFKFVQLRDTETFILVPDAYQDRVIDIHDLFSQNSRLPYVIDVNGLTARLICEHSGNKKGPCLQRRIAKNEVGCRECQDVRWVSASSLSEKAIF